MGRYVVRRLVQMVPVFIGSTLLIFLMVNVMGDPVAGLCGDRRCDPATATQLTCKAKRGNAIPVHELLGIERVS